MEIPRIRDNPPIIIPNTPFSQKPVTNPTHQQSVIPAPRSKIKIAINVENNFQRIRRKAIRYEIKNYFSISSTTHITPSVLR